MAARPRVLPEVFNGASEAEAGSFSDWLMHFESVATVNEWDEAAKLAWLKVRLTARAQKAFQRLPADAQADYEKAKKALLERFEPEAKKELFVAEFYSRRKKATEEWADFAEDLQNLAEKGFPDLDQTAREKLTLHQYLGQISNPQIAFSVKQSVPKSVAAAVTATLQMESYASIGTSKVSKIGKVTAEAEELEGEEEFRIAGAQTREDRLLTMMQQMSGRLEAVEKAMSTERPITANKVPGRQRKIICWNCHQEGHIASRCPSTPNSYIVKGQFNGVNTHFVVDTGAAITLIRKDVWCRAGGSSGELKQMPKLRLVAVDGHPLEVLGATSCNIQLGGHKFLADVIVMEALTEEGVLGLDFLEAHNCTIQTGQKHLTLGNSGISIPLDGKTQSISGDEGRINHIEVSVCEPITVPAASEMEVMVKVPENLKGPWLLEGSHHGRCGVTVAHALYEPQSDNVPVRLLNTHSKSIVLKSGTKIGTLVRMEDSVIGGVKEQVLSSGITESRRQKLTDLVNQSEEGLSDEERTQLLGVLLEYHDIFAQGPGDVGCTGVLKHSINTEGAQPIRQQVRRIPPYRRDEVSGMLSEMLQKGVIKKSASPWASPIVLAQKKDGTTRFCVDYRKVNTVTRRDAYPLPRIDDTLDTLSGSKWFSTLDLISGYWQVQMNPADQEKTAFCTPEGLFEFTVMPFGLCNAPATFQRLMDMILAGLQWNRCLVYLDDVIIIGRTFLDHLTNLSMVFERIRQAGLKLQPSKCKLCRKEVTFLGHIVSQDGIATDHSKTEQVSKWPVPSSCTEVQRFLGLANYYRRFVQDFAAMAKPLHRLTERNAQFRWTTECQRAFDKLKSCLVSAPILAFPDFTRPFILDTDASDMGIGAVLSQIHDDGSEHVVSYASRVLSKPERNYCQKHGNADAMSRIPCQQCGREDTEPTAGSTAAIKGISLRGRPVEEVKTLQLNDESLGIIVHAFEKGKRLRDDDVKGKSLETRRLVQIWDQLLIQGGILYRRFENHHSSMEYVLQVVVPRSMRKGILEELHAGVSGGHLGESKMLGRLKERYYWPGHYADVKSWCKTCDLCTTRKTAAPKQKAPLQTFAVGSPMQLVAVDILGPLPESRRGNRYILVAGDHFTHWMEAYAIPNQEAETVAQKLTEELFFRFSPPEQLHSDQGRQFESELVAQICKILNISKSRTTPYHPQGDGLVERFNRTLLDMLATTAERKPFEWEDHLQRVCFAYNTSVHPTTGYTPFFLMFGRQARLPLDLMTGTGGSKDRSYAGMQQQRQKDLYDKRAHGKPYIIGDYVWLHSPVVPRGGSRKLHHPWTGPYKVITKLSDVTYRIQSLDKKRLRKVVHFDRLKICNQVPRATVEPAKEVKEQPMNPKHTGKGYGDKLQLEEIDDDTMVQAPLDLDLPARDVFQEDIPPAEDMLDHGENPLPVMDNHVQQRDEDDLTITEENEDLLPVMDNSVRQGDEDDLAITEENEQEEDGNEVHTQELPTVPRRYPSREHRKPARFKDGYMHKSHPAGSFQDVIHAISEGNSKVIENYIDTSRTVVNACDGDQNSLLHYATAVGSVDMVNRLCSKGASVDAAGWNECRPVHRAAAEGNTGVLQALLSRGAMVNGTDLMRRTPLHMSAGDPKHLESSWVLIENGGQELERMQSKRIASICGIFTATTLSNPHHASSSSSLSLNSRPNSRLVGTLVLPLIIGGIPLSSSDMDPLLLDLLADVDQVRIQARRMLYKSRRPHSHPPKRHRSLSNLEDLREDDEDKMATQDRLLKVVADAGVARSKLSEFMDAIKRFSLVNRSGAEETKSDGEQPTNPLSSTKRWLSDSNMLDEVGGEGNSLYVPLAISSNARPTSSEAIFDSTRTDISAGEGGARERPDSVSSMATLTESSRRVGGAIGEEERAEKMMRLKCGRPLSHSPDTEGVVGPSVMEALDLLVKDFNCLSATLDGDKEVTSPFPLTNAGAGGFKEKEEVLLLGAREEGEGNKRLHLPVDDQGTSHLRDLRPKSQEETITRKDKANEMDWNDSLISTIMVTPASLSHIKSLLHTLQRQLKGKDLDVISKEVYYWSTTIDGVYHKCPFLKEKEDGRTVEGDDLQTCRVTGEVLVMSSQVIDDHAAVGTVNLIPAVRGPYMVNMIVNNICVPAPSAVWRALSAYLRKKVAPNDIAAELRAKHLTTENENGEITNIMWPVGARMDHLLSAVQRAIYIKAENFNIFLEVLANADGK
eukprot:Em0003g479a